VRQVRFALVLLTLLVLQTSLMADLPVFTVRGDLLLLLAVAAGIADGPDRGAMVGFLAGFGYDLLVSQTPVGLYALAYCLTGYAVGMVQSSVLRASWWIPVASAFGASAFGVVLFAMLGTVLGQDDMVNERLTRIALIVAAINALLIMPMLKVVRWSLPLDRRAARLGTL
jgi:rod shape-determining protein MreD